MSYDIGTSGPVLGQTQKCEGVKLVNEIPALCGICDWVG